MGFDVTFHPVSARDLQYFVFDVLDDPTLLDARMTNLTGDDEVRARVRMMFEDTLEGIDRDPDADFDNQDDDDDGHPPPDDMIRFLAAVVAGCLRPYWFARGAGLSLVGHAVEVPEKFHPLAAIGTGRIQTIPDAHGGAAFYENFTATGFMLPADVSTLSQRLNGDAKLKEALGPQGVRSLGAALRYAAERKIGLIEATDVFTIAGSLSDFKNLRGLSSPKATPPSAPATPTECPVCGLINTPGSRSCDCGQDLTAPVPERSRAGPLQGIVLIGVAVVLAGLRLAFGDFNLVNGLMFLGMVAWGLWLTQRSE